jgi:hypothetical protein
MSIFFSYIILYHVLIIIVCLLAFRETLSLHGRERLSPYKYFRILINTSLGAWPKKIGRITTYRGGVRQKGCLFATKGVFICDKRGVYLRQKGCLFLEVGELLEGAGTQYLVSPRARLTSIAGFSVPARFTIREVFIARDYAAEYDGNCHNSLI